MSQTENPAEAMRARLRAQLTAAMKGKRKDEIALLRALMAAIDNAEAVPDRGERPSMVQHDFQSGSAEAERRVLNAADIRAIIQHEIDQREDAAAEFDRLGQNDRASALRAAALIAQQFLD